MRSFGSAVMRVPSHFTRDDLRQTARLAALRALPRLDLTRSEKEQQVWLARHALGGIFDVCRWRHRNVPQEPWFESLGEYMVDERPGTDSPESWAAVTQACEAIAKIPGPLPLVLRMSLTGSSAMHIAKTLGVDPAMVTRWRSQLAKRLSEYLPC